MLPLHAPNPTSVAPRAPEADDVERLLSGFLPASAALLESRALLHRVDRKYVLPSAGLEAFLVSVRDSYEAVQSGGSRAARYDTTYFDTPERDMYHDHRRGRRPRYKVRLRHHVDRRRSFLEVKCRRGMRTAKLVRSVRFGEVQLDREATRFLETHCPHEASSLVPHIAVSFRRLTLVGVEREERITVDVDLAAWSREGHIALPGLVIVETKQRRYENGSPGIRALRGLRASEQRLSKYCLATALLAPVRCGTFRPALREVERLSA